jgi:putative pyrroloquinoline-quinone binding quinoprotein
MPTYSVPATAQLAQEWRDPHSGLSGWRVRLAPSRGIPTPAVMAGRVFVGAGFGSHEVFALDARSGALAWQLRTRDDGPTAAVAFDGFIAFNTESCTLEVVEADSGRVVWERWLGDPLLAQPAIAGNRVLMVYPRAGQHVLGAFDLTSGQPLWEKVIGHDVITAPIIAEGQIFLSTFDGAVQAFDLAGGEERWRRPIGATSAPWIYRGDIFVAQRTQREPNRASENPGQATPHAETHEDSTMPFESSLRMKAHIGEIVGAYEGKRAQYLSAASGRARKQLFDREDAAVGFAHAPAAAKLDAVNSLIGEVNVSRTWRYQGSRPVVVDDVIFETTGRPPGGAFRRNKGAALGMVRRGRSRRRTPLDTASRE